MKRKNKKDASPGLYERIYEERLSQRVADAEDEARRMLMQAFMVDVIDTISLEPLRDRLRHMVDRRFAGVKAGCSECASGCSD